MRYCLKIVATIAISTSLAACFNSHRVERDASAAAPVNDGPGLQLADRVLVTCPADGAYGSKRYDGSGEEVQRATIGALSLSGHEAIPGPFADRLDQAIEAETGLRFFPEWVLSRPSDETLDSQLGCR